MQINTVSSIQLKKALSVLSASNCVDVFYFADSFGNLNPKDVVKITNQIKKTWSSPIGFHSHDNCKLALKNVIAATKNGVTWFDGTIQGMGRGAGNVKTEEILSKYVHKNEAKKIKNISNKFFFDLKKKYNWGPSKFYSYAAKHNIHPTYVQELKKDNRYTKKEINNLIKHMATLNTRSFDPNLLETLYENNNYKGSWNGINWLKTKKILILGQGNTLRNKSAKLKIIKFIKENKPVVISINLNNYLNKSYINYYVAFNDTRILVDHKKYTKLKSPLIIPSYKLKKISSNFKIKKLINYGAKIIKDKFMINNNFCILPNNQSFGYAMALCIIGNAREVFTCGFDGFPKGHNSNEQMNLILNIIRKKYKNIKIKTLTKSNYNIQYI